jgi:hypothetical protein
MAAQSVATAAVVLPLDDDLPVCTENLNPSIVVMQTTQDWACSERRCVPRWRTVPSIARIPF